MKCVIPAAVLLLVSCGGTASTSGSAVTPVLSGDTCTLHQDATSCRADSQGCAWYANTRPCQAGAPCPAGWCYSPQTANGGTVGDGGISVSAACACPGAGGEMCVEEIGGPAIQQPPSIICEAIPSSCTLPDRCGCITKATLGRCVASDQVTNLCVCDNGIR